LSFEEIERIVAIFVNQLEFKKIRLTGGEPFARKGIDQLIIKLGELKQSADFELSATSNGILIKDKIVYLLHSGIDRFNFSLDTFDRNKFIDITGSDSLELTISAINEAIKLAPLKVKINTVIMQGINDNELLDFVEFSIINNVPVRFIEYMPFSNNKYDKSQLISYKEMINVISNKYKLIEEKSQTETVSKEYRIEGKSGRICFITSISEHFCNTCNRLRVTSDGKLKLCLFSHKDNDLDLKELIRKGATDDEIVECIYGFIYHKNEMHDSLENLIQLKNSSMISVGG
jgi:cyclic pyranopterin phosphate synthase